MTRMKLAYLVLDVRRPAAWTSFCRNLLGLPDGNANPDGSVGYRLGSAAQGLIVRPGTRDDVAALGFELESAQVVAELRARLEAAGVRATTGNGPLLAARRVGSLLSFDDPEGNRLEAVTHCARASTPFASSFFGGAFGNDATGFGHAVLVARNLDEMARFYVEALGFRVSERLATRVGPIDVRGVFLHCNRRHHSLALMTLPSRKKLHHFMLEAGSAIEVARAHDRARALRIPASLGLGQHPDPDGTFSFYGRTPSGFDFEIGAGGKEIEPARWQERASATTSSWGHKPTLGLQLRAARDLVASRMGL